MSRRQDELDEIKKNFRRKHPFTGDTIIEKKIEQINKALKFIEDMDLENMALRERIISLVKINENKLRQIEYKTLKTVNDRLGDMRSAKGRGGFYNWFNKVLDQARIDSKK